MWRNWSRACSEPGVKLAVVLFNLGGPDWLEAVKPFLQTFFSDPAIISLPGFVRKPLARFIAARRAPLARKIYAQMGGRSPILPETEAQARALEGALARGGPRRADVSSPCATGILSPTRRSAR